MAIDASLILEIRRAVAHEISAQAKKKTALYLSIDEIELVEDSPGQLVYRFILVEAVKVPVDGTLRFRIPREPRPVEVQVLSCQDNILLLKSEVPLGQLAAGLLRVEFDATFILRKLEEHLDQVLRRPPGPLAAVLARDLPQVQVDHLPDPPKALLNDTQASTSRHLLGQQVHLLWGPPGTGKTHTLGAVIAEHMRRGNTCLLLSTSNVAVDELVKSVRRNMPPPVAEEKLLRVGVALSEEVRAHTSLGHLEREFPAEARAWREAQGALADIARKRNGNSELLDQVVETIRRCQEAIRLFSERAHELDEKLMIETPCVAATLSALVLREPLAVREFDVVVVDEASMVSLAFAFAGGAQATKHLVYAGDFKQLPPICVSTEREAIRWFGRSIFHHFDIEETISKADVLPPFVSMLTDQFRMTKEIGSVVSDLSYGGRLATAVLSGQTTRPKFIDVHAMCPTTWYSVQYQSYFHPYTPLLLSQIKREHPDWLGPSNLLLSPFRGQATLLAALGRDLAEPHMLFSSSTIHKSQGSQQDTVIVDLTAHDHAKAQQFFTGDSAENLLNVAMSRAQKRLIMLGNLELVAQLAKTNEYWQRFQTLVNERFDVVPVVDVVRSMPRNQMDLANAIDMAGGQDEVMLPALFVSGDGAMAFTPELVGYFGGLKASTRLVVQTRPPQGVIQGALTYREEKRVRPFSIAKGVIALPIRLRERGYAWLTTLAPSTSKQLFSVACGHLFDDSFKPENTLRLVCGRCSNMLALSFNYGMPFLGCPCGYSRPMSEGDARVLIETTPTMRCPSCGAKPAPRRTRADGRVFMGCSNYPHCQGIVNLRDYDECRQGPARLR